MQNSIHFKFHNQFLLVIATVFLLLIFWNLTLVNFFFAFNIIPSPVLFYSAVLLSLSCTFFLTGKYFFVDWKIFLVGILTAIAIFFYAKTKGEKYFDVSWDGQAYQLEAVIKMLEGWNPLKSYLENSAKQENIYINHYPRGAWYNAFSFYMVTGNIESAKLFNFIWIVIPACLGTVVFNQFFKINFFIALLIALVAATNPVAIYQSTTNYIDGQVAAGILTFILLAILLFFIGNVGPSILLSLTISIIVNYKFSVPFYLIVLSAGVILVFWIYKNIEGTKKIIGSGLIGFVFGIGVLGFSPYITNLVEFQNPLYPLFEKTKPEITNGIEESIQPVSFENMNRMERLFQANFSKGVWSRTPYDNELKIPGIFTDDEHENYKRPDCEMAGFGPYFSLALLICFVLLPVIFFINRTVFYLVILVISFLLLSTLITNVGWLARYAPQFFLICIVILVAAFHLKNLTLLFSGAICLTLLMKNDAELIDINYACQKLYTNDLKNSLKDLSKRSDTVLVYFDRFSSNRARFKKYNIKFREVKSIKELNVDSPRYFHWINKRIATN